jgi:uncharacterized membrane protein (GlpM family)
LFKAGESILSPGKILHTMDYLYTLLKFVMGGSIIVGVTVLAKHMDPRYGGILAAAPMITTLAFLFTWSEAGRQTTQHLVIATFWFVIPTMVFLLAFYFLMSRFSLLMTLAGHTGSGSWPPSS